MTPHHSPSGVGVRFDSVSKRYGTRFALRNVSLAVPPGEFVVLFGANGSGKTTLLKAAALLVRLSAGRVRFTGVPGEDSVTVKQAIGYLGHNTLLYDELTAEENLLFVGRLFALSGLADRARSALEAAGLAERRGDLVRTFSRGMRQRLSVARALLHGPRLLLLDEPTTGLDEGGIAWLAASLAALTKSGCTVLMSSHGRNALVELASRQVRLEAGRLVVDEPSRAQGRT